MNIIPTKDYLKIAYRLPVKITAKLTLYNTIGGVVYQAKSDNGYFLIETKKLSTGIYIIKFNANEYKATKKLVIH